MKKQISRKEYTGILTITYVIVIIAMLAIFAGGAYALMKTFHLQGYQGVAIFLLFVVLWLRKPKTK